MGERERVLEAALRELISKSDDIHAAIEGTTDQFEAEVSALSEATSAAEKVLLACQNVWHTTLVPKELFKKCPSCGEVA